MNIRVDLNYAIKDGTEVVFRSPVDCSQVTGLKVYSKNDGSSKEFAFADAHGNNVGDIDHLFAENVVVKVILDVTHAMAFVQNADTNAYIESTFIKTVNGIAPDENGNVEVEIPEGSSGGNVDLTGYATEQWVQEGYQPKGNYLTEVPAGYAKTEDIPTKPEDIGAQPAGSYLTEVPSGYATEEYVRNKIAEAELGGEEVDLSGYAQKSELPTKVSQLQNDAGYLDAIPDGYAKTEDIPTQPSDIGAQPEGDYALRSEIPSVPVKSVNGKTGAVSLSASDVGALPSTTKIPAKTSELTNDSGFITGYTETDPTVPAWAKASSKPSYSKSEVGLSNVDNVKQYSASNPPPYPVTSVNGKTGAVNLDASAVGARPSTWMPSASEVGALPASTTIPTKVSQLNNDAKYITSEEMQEYINETFLGGAW